LGSLFVTGGKEMQGRGREGDKRKSEKGEVEREGRR